MKYIPNFITTSRIILSLVLLLIKPLSIAFYIIYISCGLSDIIDGYIARKYNITSKIGAKLDTIADFIFTVVLAIVIYPFINFTIDIIICITAIFIIRLVSILVVWIKFRTFAILHTILNKTTGILLLIFLLFINFISIGTLIYLISGIATLSAIEELIMDIKAKKLDINIKSILVMKSNP